jgi:DNA-binding transcriptional LysR family regulator
MLARIRAATGDAILTRAGRRLVPTPRAVAMRAQVRAVVEEARGLLRPQSQLPADVPARAFRIRANEGFAGVFASAIMAGLQRLAPQLNLRFVGESDEDPEALRDGVVDLEIGVIGPRGPEVKLQALYRDRFVGIARQRHPIFKRPIDMARYAGCLHVGASRRGLAKGPIDAALAQHGASRCVALVVPGFYAALYAVAGSDLVGAVPESVAAQAAALKLPIRSFDLPVKVPPAAVAQAWHPRFDGDVAHRLLREQVRAACRR